MDRELWLEEKSKRCEHFASRKLPRAFVRYLKKDFNLSKHQIDDLRCKLLHIEENFAIDLDICFEKHWIDQLEAEILFLEKIYEIIMAPEHDARKSGCSAWGISRFLSYCPCPAPSLRHLLDSIHVDLWKILTDNCPLIGSPLSMVVEWVLRQSKGIKLCLDGFYSATSYAEAHVLIMAIVFYMGNIYHCVQRLRITKLSDTCSGPRENM